MTEWILEASDLWFGYEEHQPVLRGVTLKVPAGQFVALVGANGSGKTTLLKQFNGLLRPQRGQVRVAGQDVARCSLGEMARQVGYLFQHPEQQIFSPTVWQEVAFGPRNLGLSSPEVEDHVRDALARFDLKEVAHLPPAILSYGLRRRVTLASLAAMDPPILVLDEPTVGLDYPGLQETIAWITELRALGRTIVLSTHEMDLVAEHAERVVVLHEGQLIADGPPADLFRQGDLLSRASLIPPPVVVLAEALRSYGLPGESLSVEALSDEYVALVKRRHELPL
ncbi:MAG: energy-coupling factor ABC transporter ATP-binding protein [Anaerolineae bacterium]